MRKFHRIKATAETTPSLFTERVRARRTSKLDGLQARLHRGNRADILCGRPTCRGKLGALEEVLGQEFPKTPDLSGAECAAARILELAEA